MAVLRFPERLQLRVKGSLFPLVNGYVCEKNPEASQRARTEILRI
jgi:hypothetical protein